MKTERQPILQHRAVEILAPRSENRIPQKYYVLIKLITRISQRGYGHDEPKGSRLLSLDSYCLRGRDRGCA